MSYGARGYAQLPSGGAAPRADVFFTPPELNMHHSLTALELAARHGHVAVAAALLDASDARVASDEPWPLPEELRDEYEDEGDDVDSTYTPDVEWVEERKTWALSWAALAGHAHVAALLVDRGVDPNYQNGTPLDHAVRGGHLETARALLQRGARAEAAAVREGLVAARRGGHAEVVALLREHGAVDEEE